ncbi:MAG: transcriptional regulator [Nocardiopsaceae bacterium]|jgi:predicted ArsR family transcriptional regulator|nr:transcriptional regulator [Nocardiopsaceae bacterium]
MPEASLSQEQRTVRDAGAVAVLGEPARRALYEYVAAQGRPVSRDEAATATGVKRATAAFHLDRLVESGLLEAGFARVSGRTGPGAGRTAKLYARSAREFAISLPPRRYEIAASVLAGALTERLRGGDPGATVASTAEQAGQRLAEGCPDLASALTGAGYEPRRGPGGEIQLANCPFHELVQRYPELVCSLNLHLLRGLLAGLDPAARPRLDPAPGRCCVTITRQP